MASAERLLNEAQYAFQSISFGESKDNRRNRRRASSLCKKIIRRFPASIEAGEAHAILRRLGEEAYVSRMPLVHQHSASHTIPDRTAVTPQAGTEPVDDAVPLDWGGLVSLLARMPKAIWGVAVIVGLVLFGAFGFFLFLPLIAILLFTGPFRGTLQPGQRRKVNELVIALNSWIDDRHRSRSGHV